MDEKLQGDRAKIQRKMEDLKVNMKNFKQWSLREPTRMSKQMKERDPVQLLFKKHRFVTNQSKRYLLFKKLCRYQTKRNKKSAKNYALICERRKIGRQAQNNDAS